MNWKNVVEKRKETEISKIPGNSHKKEVYIDFWTFLVYNSIMISQVMVTVTGKQQGNYRGSNVR